MLPDHWSTAAVYGGDRRSMVAVNDGDRRSMVAVNDDRRWRTTVDHHRTTGQPPVNSESLSEYELKMILFNKIDKSRSYLTHEKHQVLFDALLNSILLDDAIARGQADPEKVLRKRDRNDEDPSCGPNQGKKTKRSRTKEFEPSNKSSTSKESSKGPIYEMLKGTCTRSIKLEYNMEECFKTLTDKLDWSNPEGDHCPFDLTKLLPLKGRPGRLTVAAEYNHDLEFLKSSDLEKKYNKDAENGSSTRVKTSALKLHGHGHLEEIVVRRDDRYLYKFKEGDFVDLHLNDIKDMLLLVVQHKLFQLDGSDIVDFIVALRMFTRSLIIKDESRIFNLV
nr:hypothetical protein [Tanacetum cinerariifolium]